MSTSGTRRPLVAGNWKMNLNHLEAIALTQKLAFSLTPEQLSTAEVVVLPPFVDLRSVQSLVEGDKLLLGFGGQDLSPFDSGAYTGDISGAMLAKLGCGYVTVGHSERREYHNESDELVNAKARAAIRHGLSPIICVGEHIEVRRAGQHVEHCSTQLAAALAGITAAQAVTVVLAYEPLWAIGTGEVATAADAQEVCAALRALVGETFGADVGRAVRVLYGGSVKSDNVEQLLVQRDIDGALVGGASLHAEQFAAICRAAASFDHAR